MELDTQTIELNYRRLQESRERSETTLEQLFEQRMNKALDDYLDSIGNVALVGANND
jgi:hypothetical protein